MTRIQAEAQRARGSALMVMGEKRQAFEQLSQAYASYQALGDTASAARLLLEIGMTRRSLGQLDEAETAYTQALELWESTGNLAWQSNLLNNLGVLQHERGEYLAAAHSLERAVECARLAGYPRMEAFALAGLGDLYRDLEAFSEAAEAYRQAAGLAGRVEERNLLLYLDMARSVLARRQKQMACCPRLPGFGGPADRERRILSWTRLLTGWRWQPWAWSTASFSEVRLPSLGATAAFFAERGMRVEAARCLLILMIAAALPG